MYIDPRPSTPATSSVKPSSHPGTSPGTPTATPPTDTSKDTLRRYSFEGMTVGELTDTLNELFFSGQVSGEDACAVSFQYERFAPDLTREEFLSMPLNLSYADLREDIAFARTSGDTKNEDRLTRVLDILQRFEGRPRGINVKA